MTETPAQVAEVTVNGEPSDLAAGMTIAAFLEHLGHDPRTVAIEHNGAIIKRGLFAETALAAGDRLEIVRFVQGG